MESFWNAGEREKIQGLDVLGLRQVDQNLEREWVAGITTISFRARYLTFLPWVLAELYEYELRSSAGKAVVTLERLGEVLARLKFVVLAATAAGSDWGESGNTFGVLGSDNHAARLEEFRATGRVNLDLGRSTDVYGTYIMPCSGFGLLDAVGVSGEEPVRIPPRGRDVALVRRATLSGSKITSLLLEGGTLSTEDVRATGSAFSVNALSRQETERERLIDSMFTPYPGGPGVKTSYDNFNSTTRWAAGFLRDAPCTAAEIIAENYRRVTTRPPASAGPVELAWAEYELRRRAHFACELLLADVADTLADLTSGTVDTVVERWMRGQGLSPAVREALGGQEPTARTTLADVLSVQPEDAFLGSPLRSREGRDQASGGNRAFYALALLCAVLRQSAGLRASGRLLNREHYMERAFARLGENRSNTIPAVLRDLALRLAVEPHLITTLRKMGQGQQCSLRFFPEGSVLQPTGIPMTPGFSGSRLGNVLGMLADVGLCNRLAEGRFELTGSGRALLAGCTPS